MANEITQEMLDEAAGQESQESALSPEVLRAQNVHLGNRVVLLRAAANALTKENEELRVQLEALKNKQPRKQAAKKTAAPKKRS